MDIERLYNNVRKITPDTLASEVFREAKIARFVLNLNREGQLFADGVGVDGQIVGTYSFMTQQFSENISGKGFPKIAGNPYNFYNTGEMYNSFSIRVEKDGFVINADTSELESSGIIENKEEIIGLTDESIEKLVKEILPELAKEVTKQILQ